MSVEFFITSLFIVVTPGTGMIYTLLITLRRGLRMGVLAALGGTLSILSHMTAAALGVAALLHASAMAFQMVKFAGVAYLLFMAYRMMKDKEQFDPDQLKGDEPHKKTAVGVMRDGILLNLLNPKLSIFFLAFLPQFIDINTTSPLADMVVLSAVFMAMTFVVFAMVAAAAASVRDKLLSQPQVMTWLKRGFAATFVALGAKLALTQR
ncbi:LysE family translocator [Cohaesibacter haloalkalitolerans]|uniref:LysE family translocator n=1 Tax=Cohaesibacter haloalkalitolerans TaxID=1162980 RepID=UPI000E6518C3|nr:LysE family translocator [Cohaesibacter haloalkalitolerans]